MTARLRVRLTPRGGADRIDAVETGADGKTLVRARVRTPPVDGAANAALARLMATALGLPRSAVNIAHGATSRVKTVEVVGLDTAACLDRLSRAAGAGD